MWADRGEIIITNDYNGLNSSCLKEMANYTSQMSIFGIQDTSTTTYLPEFIELLLNSERTIKNIALVNTRLSPATLSKIFSKDLHSITQLTLSISFLIQQITILTTRRFRSWWNLLIWSNLQFYNWATRKLLIYPLKDWQASKCRLFRYWGWATLT